MTDWQPPKGERAVRSTEIVSDGSDLFIMVDSVKVAKRGKPGTRQAKQWVSIEPGYTVRDVPRRHCGGV